MVLRPGEIDVVQNQTTDRYSHASQPRDGLLQEPLVCRSGSHYQEHRIRQGSEERSIRHPMNGGGVDDDAIVLPANLLEQPTEPLR